MPDPTPPKLNWRFPRTFWFANVAELFERAAYYGMAIALAHYLTDRIGFTDVSTGYVAAAFASILYLLPTFSGILADRIGFRRALLLAFALLAVGYALLGVAGLAPPDAAPTTQAADVTHRPLLFSELPRKLIVAVALAVIMFGGSIVKPVISGTAAKCSDAAHRARAFSIFYAMINIGSFTGKSVAAPLRISLGLEYINFYAASMALCALVVIAAAYRDVDSHGAGRTYAEAGRSLMKVLRNFRFMCLILIVAGFWTIQHQLYASMTKYIIRLLGESAKPEWLANINPAVVVLLVLPITHLLRRVRAENTIAIALALITVSALCIALSAAVQAVSGNSVALPFGLALHPITLMVILGIGLQGVAECFLSPKFLEYGSKQAPPDEVGLYMGYLHLSSFFAYFFGFVISGYLLDWYCPDPNKLSEAARAQRELALATGASLPPEYAHAHYIWYVFSGIGLAALLAMLAFMYVTAASDRRRAATA